jgi:hypothetical protein
MKVIGKLLPSGKSRKNCSLDRFSVDQKNFFKAWKRHKNSERVQPVGAN